MTTTGLLLAAGGGRRMGRPKALVEGWLVRSVEALADCDEVVVVLGAAADEARALLVAHDVTIVVNPEWSEGMGSSLHAGLAHVLHGEATRCVLSLVDLPDVGARCRRNGCWRSPTSRASSPERCTTGGRATPSCSDATTGPASWRAPPATRERATTCAAHDVDGVECADLATGADVDDRDRDPTGGQPGRRTLRDMELTPRRRWRPPSRAPATSPTTRWPRSCTSPRGCSGRCSSRVSPAPARPRWPRRWRRWRTCR